MGQKNEEQVRLEDIHSALKENTNFGSEKSGKT